ncbi:hypothetical protein RR46_13350 [Papilio xuthus]|uniref:Uncharacterized protein n=1 Tax=Papilio xuthus TaxID=66420 RepID=A0A194PHE2_PAPXU|nr:hypothetical protein RR46_13350 [Papilio xuthus]
MALPDNEGPKNTRLNSAIVRWHFRGKTIKTTPRTDQNNGLGTTDTMYLDNVENNHRFIIILR